jgi:hypothetical protein
MKLQRFIFLLSGYSTLINIELQCSNTQAMVAQAGCTIHGTKISFCGQNTLLVLHIELITLAQQHHLLDPIRKGIFAEGVGRGESYLIRLGGVGAGAGVPSPPPRRLQRERAVPAPRLARRRRNLVGRGLVDLAGEPGEALPVGRDGAPHRRVRRHGSGSLRRG